MNGSQLYFNQIQQQRDNQSRYDILITLFQTESIILSLLQYHQYARQETYYSNNSNWLRLFIIQAQLCSIIFILYRYNSGLQIIKFKHNRVDENLSLYKVNLMFPLIFEIAVNLIVNPPFVNEFGIEVLQIGRNVSYTMDAIVSIIAILRFTFYSIRCLQHYSLWLSERADKVAIANGYRADTLFAIKMHLNIEPGKVLAITFMISLFCFSVLFYIAEVGQRNSGEYNRFEKFENAAWVASQNLLGAGVSGLEIPNTHLGMLMSVFCCLIASGIFSLFIIMWQNIT